MGKRSRIFGWKRLGLFLFVSGFRDLSLEKKKRKRSKLFSGRKFGVIQKSEIFLSTTVWRRVSCVKEA